MKNTPPKYTLRKIRRTDLSLILKWRNHESIRAVSGNSSLINITTHSKWFHRTPNLLKYLFLIESIPSGVVIYDKRFSHWNIYLDPKLSKNMNYGSIMADLMIQKLQKSRFFDIMATIQKNNETSLRFHEKLGFELVGEVSDTCFVYRKEL